MPEPWGSDVENTARATFKNSAHQKENPRRFSTVRPRPPSSRPAGATDETATRGHQLIRQKEAPRLDRLWETQVPEHESDAEVE